jgi:hypothetical protein
MSLITNALAETAELTPALAGLTPEETAFAVGLFTALVIVWAILQIIADWKIFTKAGEAGWKSIIPIYNYFVEYRLCWKGLFGLVFGALSFGINLITGGDAAGLTNGQMILVLAGVIVMAVLHCIESQKLSRAFGKGTGFGLCLFLFGPIARLVLGFGKACYVGRAL